MTGLSPPLRRAAALGLLLALLLLVEAAVVSPFLAWRDGVAARHDAAVAMLLRTATIAATAEAEATALEAALAASGPVLALLPASADGVAAARLQSILQEAAAAERLTLASLQVEATTEAEGHRRIALRAALRGRYAPVLALLQRLETGAPLLRLRALEIQATGPGEDPELAVGFEVVALMPVPPG